MANHVAFPLRFSRQCDVIFENRVVKPEGYVESHIFRQFDRAFVVCLRTGRPAKVLGGLMICGVYIVACQQEVGSGMWSYLIHYLGWANSQDCWYQSHSIWRYGTDVLNYLLRHKADLEVPIRGLAREAKKRNKLVRKGKIVPPLAAIRLPILEAEEDDMGNAHQNANFLPIVDVDPDLPPVDNHPGAENDGAEDDIPLPPDQDDNDNAERPPVLVEGVGIGVRHQPSPQRNVRELITVVRERLNLANNGLREIYTEAVQLAFLRIWTGEVQDENLFEDLVIQGMTDLLNSARVNREFVNQEAYRIACEREMPGSVYGRYCSFCRHRFSYASSDAFRNHYERNHCVFQKTFRCPFGEGCRYTDRIKSQVLTHFRHVHNKRGLLDAPIAVPNMVFNTEEVYRYRDGLRRTPLYMPTYPVAELRGLTKHCRKFRVLMDYERGVPADPIYQNGACRWNNNICSNSRIEDLWHDPPPVDGLQQPAEESSTDDDSDDNKGCKGQHGTDEECSAEEIPTDNEAAKSGESSSSPAKKKRKVLKKKMNSGDKVVKDADRPGTSKAARKEEEDKKKNAAKRDKEKSAVTKCKTSKKDAPDSKAKKPTSNKRKRKPSNDSEDSNSWTTMADFNSADGGNLSDEDFEHNRSVTASDESDDSEIDERANTSSSSEQYENIEQSEDDFYL